MTFSSSYIPYKQTGAFSSIIEDYLESKDELQQFYLYQADISGIRQAIADRKGHNYSRELLTAELRKQYSSIELTDKVSGNIESLLSPDTFTICTAHQPNIFTGHLYFIYKILHAIKLADELNTEFKANHFVPVYYMGSEDADLEELGEVNINGKKYEWKTKQKGAVGRMQVDTAFIEMINQIEGQLSVEKYGEEILRLVRRTYTPGKTIEAATFELVHELFQDRGLLIFLPDNGALKKEFQPVVEKELKEQFSKNAVAAAIAAFPEKYKVQAAGRDINLFYLKADSRERIENFKNGFVIANTNERFTPEEMMRELNEHPERFSPNVILRPVFQEMILPNLVFIGGGGELAYWLELKDVFAEVNVPFPVLILRNSFMVVKKKTAEQIEKLNLTINDFFSSEKAIIEKIVRRDTMVVLELTNEKQALGSIYSQIQAVAANVDPSLNKHVIALSETATKRIGLLEKKMLKAEKKKFEASLRQVVKIRSVLFPGGSLQERVDNLMPFYAIWGKGFLDTLYANSTGLKQEFCILEEK